MLNLICQNWLMIQTKLTLLLFLTPRLPAPGKMQNSVSCLPFMKIKCFQSTFYQQEMWVLELQEWTNYLSVQNINGIRKLLKENQPVETVSLDKTLQEFHTFLSQVKCSSPKESCIVLIGHNSSTFDTPILLRRSDENFRSKLSNLGPVVQNPD